MTFKRLSKISLTSSPQRSVLLTALTTLVLTLFLTTAAPAMLIVDTGVQLVHRVGLCLAGSGFMVSLPPPRII